MAADKKSLITAFLLEGILILFLNITIHWDLRPEEQQVVLWSAPLGMILFLCGVLCIKGDRFYNWLNLKLQKAGAWLGTSPLQVFLFITSPIFVFLTINAAGFWIEMWSPYAAVATWLLAIGLALLGGWKFGEPKPRLAKGTILWLAALIVFGFLLRGLATGEVPVILTGDEASAGVSGARFARGEWSNLFITSWFSFPSLFSFLQSIGIRIFGNTIEALRIPSALAGALTVGAVYLCAKSMFGQRAGIFAALVLATLHFHIHFSRLGLNNIWDGLWFTLTVGALWLGWNRQARWAYLLAGLSLGFAQYFYVTSKALIIVVVAAAFFAFLFQRVRFRQTLPDVCAASIVTLAVFMPLAWYYMNEPNALWAPFARVSILNEVTASGASFGNFMVQLLPMSLGAYTHIQFSVLSFWYGPGTALLRPIAATFFYVGLIFLLFQDRDSRFTLMALWLVAIALGNALSSHIPAAQRYIAAAPACALVAGYGLHKIAETLAGLWSRSQKLISAIAYFILVCIMVSDLWFYFADYTIATRLIETTSNGMLAHQFGGYLKDQPIGTQVVFFGIPRLCFDSPAVLYLAPQIKGVNAPEEWQAFDRSQLTSPNIIFVFLPEYQDDIKAIQADYPDGKLRIESAWNGDILYWVYEHAAK
jgi:4-amino-4-deoxy-L-arabinose transferase-like glycosyltransferase